MKHIAVGAWLAVSIGACAWSTLAWSTPEAASAIHPIVSAQRGYLLGGSKNGKWVKDKQTATTLQGGEAYRVYGENARRGQTTGAKPTTGEAPCDETQWVKLGKNFNGAVGVGGSWNAVPRAARVQNVHQKTYRNLVAQILKAGKIKNPQVHIAQLWRVDLDGDKIDEVLLSATRYKSDEKPMPNYISSSAGAGDYSLVLLRKIVKGKVETITLAGEIYSQKKEFSAPSVHRIAGVCDLNGDGKMEVLLDSRYYEGDWMSVVEVKGGKATEVLSAGCGA